MIAVDSLLIKLKAISDPTRLQILRLIIQRSYCVRALSQKLGITESAVSQHMKILREAGLVTGEKHGYWVHYRAKREVVEDFLNEVKVFLLEESV